MVVDVASARVELLKALADPVRWEIVERLSREELCVCHLVDDLGHAQPLVSHHLKALRSAGIVESERFKQWVYYRLRPHVLAGLGRTIGDLADGTPPAGGRRRACG